MADDNPTLPVPESSQPSPEPSALQGLTAALGLDPAQSDHDPLLGRDVGGVTIVRPIGEGGMGRVYEGRQEKPGRTVAVKIMRPGLTSPSFLKRFEHEAEVLGRLQHPGIAHIYSVGVHRIGGASVPYFVMEYIADAKTLTDYAADLKLPTRQRLDLFRSVCDAVAHGHQKGVIHRDLKPSNILVDVTGQPKVIDFGVARVTDSDMALTTMQTDVGDMIGTLQYMSPEQFDANPHDIDVRSDVYALGVVLYELLADKPPYDVREKAIYEVMRIVKEEDPTPLSSVNRALKGDVAVIAGKCLEKDRGRRYASAGELGSDIGRYLSGDPISARPPGFVDGLVRLARRHRAAAAAMAGVFLTLVIATIGIGIFAGRAEEARRRAEQERGVAERARAVAEDSRRDAEAAEDRALREKGTADQRLYEANCYRVQQLIKECNFDVARAMLREMSAPFKGRTLPIELACFQAACDQSVMCLEGHEGEISTIAFSPDGTRLATSGGSTTLSWDLATGKRLAVLERTFSREIAFSPDGSRLVLDKGRGGLRDAVTGKEFAVLEGVAGFNETLAFSPDSTRFVTLTVESGRTFESGKTYRLWDAVTKKQVAVLEGQVDWISHAAFSPDGKRLVTAGTGESCRLWDAKSGKQLAEFQVSGGFNMARQAFFHLAFSADGARLATTPDSKTVLLYDATTGAQLAECADDHIHELVLSPDGKLLATRSSDEARLWDATTGKQLAVLGLRSGNQFLTLGGRAAAACVLAFSPDGSRLATAAHSFHVAQLWDATTGKQIAVLEGHGKPILSLAFSPDGTRLATRSEDKTARLWDVATGRQLAVFPGHEDVITALAFSPDGTWLATGSCDKTVRLWNTANLKPEKPFAEFEVGQNDRVLSSDAARMATTSESKAVRLWDMATGKQLAVLECLGEYVYSVACNADGTRLAVTENNSVGPIKEHDYVVRVWDATSGRQLAVCQYEDTEALDVVCLSPDGTRLTTQSALGHIRLWDLTQDTQATVLEPEHGVRVIFSPDGTRLTTWSDKMLRTWDAMTGKLLAEFETHGGYIDELGLSPDGTRLAAGWGEGTGPGARHDIRLWDVENGKQFAVLEGHTGYVNCLAFSPDGSRLATGSNEETVRLWDMKTAQQLAVLEGHRDSVFVLAFSPDGSRLATGSRDETVRLWDATSGKQLAVLEGHGSPVRDLIFSADGTRLEAITELAIRSWGVSNADLHRARLETSAIEERLRPQVAAWLEEGRDTAVTRLRAAKKDLSPNEYRVAENMIIEACWMGDRAK